MDDHLYYWAWSEADNKGISYFQSNYDRLFRVWRANAQGKDEPITEPMQYEEAIAYTHRIAKLTEGRILT